MDNKKLTNRTSAGTDNQNMTVARAARITAGRLVPENGFHFDREVIPERRMHAKGSELGVFQTMRHHPLQLGKTVRGG